MGGVVECCFLALLLLVPCLLRTRLGFSARCKGGRLAFGRGATGRIRGGFHGRLRNMRPELFCGRQAVSQIGRLCTRGSPFMMVCTRGTRGRTSRVLGRLLLSCCLSSTKLHVPSVRGFTARIPRLVFVCRVANRAGCTSQYCRRLTVFYGCPS